MHCMDYNYTYAYRNLFLKMYEMKVHLCLQSCNNKCECVICVYVFFFHADCICCPLSICMLHFP